MPINTAGAKAILDIITAHPALYNQDEWVGLEVADENDYQQAAARGLTADALIELDRQHNDSEYNECSTTFCVAGWGTMLSGWTVYRMLLGEFAVEFGLDLVKEMYESDPTIRHCAERSDYRGLSDYAGTVTAYRDPNGKWNYDHYGPTNPNFARIGAQFLGLDTLHGAHLANRLFRGDAHGDEVIDALTALSNNSYPDVLVKRELQTLDRSIEALEDADGAPFPEATPFVAANDLEDLQDKLQADCDEFHQTNQLSFELLRKLRARRQIYTLANATSPAPDLAATISR